MIDPYKNDWVSSAHADVNFSIKALRVNSPHPRESYAIVIMCDVDEVKHIVHI